MKRELFFVSIVLISILFIRCNKSNELVQAPVDSTLKSASVAGKYIVVLKEDQELAISDFQTRNLKIKGKASGLLKKYEVPGEIEEVYETALQGFTVRMTPGQQKKMEEDPNVKYITADQIITLSPIMDKGKPGGGTSQPPQQDVWGVSRVGGGASYNGTRVAWIIDTGIDMKHPDLNVDQIRGRSFIRKALTPNDDDGHGTHVAGIIAAKNNAIGVVGVAAGALVIPIKVLDKNGSGAYSGVIEGVDYVAANGQRGDVANMSLGGPPYPPLDEAVINTGKLGIQFTLAAGNESADANNSSPARADGKNIYTVSAMGEGDIWAYFSNFGNPPVDYCAPGVSILSTYKGGWYAYMSGTSMAAPHVAGLLLWGNIRTDGFVTGDPDNNADPIAHR